jgi:glycine betaine/proline transport system substrate-binding protein
MIMKHMIKQLLAVGTALTVATAAIAETIKIAYPNWAEGIAMTHLAKAILEDKLGYDVELTQADPGVIYGALASGDQDAFLDAWLPNTHEPYWEQYKKDLIDLGPNFAYGVTGLVVPSYVKVDSIEQLNRIKDDLDGKIIGIDSGAGITRNTYKAIEEYGLDLELVNSSGPAMTAALKNAIDNRKAIVVTGWKPHWKFGRYDLKVLADPRGVYPIDGCKTIARKGFAKDFPEVAQFLMNFNLTEADLLDLMLKIDDSDDDVLDVALDWMESNEALVNSWIPRM